MFTHSQSQGVLPGCTETDCPKSVGRSAGEVRVKMGIEGKSFTSLWLTS